MPMHPSSSIEKTRQRRLLGARGEALAAAHLQAKGMRILRRNVRVGRGEIDLIALDGHALVFVEVRTLTQQAMMQTPEQSVGFAKQRSMQRAARAFTKFYRVKFLTPRIDVIAIELPADGEPIIRHHKNAISFNVTI